MASVTTSTFKPIPTFAVIKFISFYLIYKDDNYYSYMFPDQFQRSEPIWHELAFLGMLNYAGMLRDYPFDANHMLLHRDTTHQALAKCDFLRDHMHVTKESALYDRAVNNYINDLEAE